MRRWINHYYLRRVNSVLLTAYEHIAQNEAVGLVISLQQLQVITHNMANQWFKVYGGEYLSDPKIAALSPQERSCWLTLLCLASVSTELGVIDYLTVEVLLEKSGIRWDPYNPEEWNTSLSVLKKFEQMKMITTDDSGRITIVNWCKRQDTAMSGYERLKKYRQNKAISFNDNELITDDNDDDSGRIDKNRIDKNRIYNTNSGGVAIDALFELFWKAYPRKIAKPNAIRSWKKLNPDEKLTKAILTGVEKWKTTPQWKKDNGQFIPHPATFLNQRRWEDELSSKPTSTKYDNLSKKI